ncbi:MAG: O-acetylhomoserine aminocarboxypropyltransferase/cysteine synthase [Clostridiales Family XIII bacterium]|jgi:O-acetylhomoserine (thiol)-lyase|nr:O-acetylhomoserine aminocarboxypropyltransferase/cysteine synthase [Clostridiales Family XIII bacterium]
MAYKAFEDKTLGFSTRQLHAGYDPSEHHLAKAVPIYQSAAFEIGSYERSIRLFSYQEEGTSYVRFSNPTTTVLERRVASLEGGTAAIAMGSGMAAISSALLNLASPGDNIVASRTIYGGSDTFFKKLLPRYGVNVTFVANEDDPESFEAALSENTKAIFIETIGNPLCNIIDIERVAKIAHAHNIPLVVDNTFATPYLLRPFEYGADIVCYSATKYLNGHGNSIAGICVEKGDFDWLGNGKYPYMETFYEEHKNTIGEETLGRELFTKKMRIEYLTELGAHISPQTSFYLMQGIETLSLRMDRHVRNALEVAKFLEGHAAVKEVSYPGLPSSKYFELAKKYFPGGRAGAIMSLRMNGGLEAAKRVLDRVRLFDYMVNVGDAKSMIVHPATSTNFGQLKEVSEAAGVYEDTLRLSIGCEDAEDLIADLEQALKQS